MASFADCPLAFIEEPEEERARVERLRAEDPISLQDAVNTSQALVAAAKDGDIEEVRRVVANAEEGEFLQVFVLQAVVHALRAVSLGLMQEFVRWGVPLRHEQLTQAMHLICEVTTRDNFSDAWRILQLLMEGNANGGMDINQPRSVDGWTPLCIACVDACLPLAFKLLELKADPNIITRSDETPLALAKRALPGDTEEQREARGIISNMLRSYGAQESTRDVLAMSRGANKRPTGAKAA
uniref:Uncharacterized protein n=1 Tax=Alexandrium monilatum TaxID=311494 RepID=A0A7S4VBZ9_9DINO|mmetsp:Transcript_114583/g.365389  ORF Transcript_114583/g.365389 Transcript_114583/m.365389 type:complete len:240 (+) Transcript_114583:58-777(+)